MSNAPSPSPATVLVLTAMLVAAAVPAQGIEVGTTAAVNTDTYGTPPAAETRLLSLGTEVVFEERIETSASGSTQILFRDQSTVTVGPNSELVIDRYVYDPRSGTGETVMSFTKGVLRFVGGQISKSEGAVTIRTPTATVGIRGGIGILRQGDDGTRAIFVAGDEMGIASPGSSEIKITRPGGSATVFPSGFIEDTGVAASDEIARANGETQGNGGGGLAGEPPSGEAASDALNAGLAQDDRVLDQPPASIGSAAGPPAAAGDSLGRDLAALAFDALQGLATAQGAAAPGTAGEAEVDDAEDAASEDAGPTVGDGAGPTPRAGRLVATPDGGYTTTFGDAFTDPAAQFVLGGPTESGRYDLAVTDIRSENGRWTATTSSGGIDLPLGSGSFAVGAGTTPFGAVTGSGFHDAANDFAFYALTTGRTDLAERIAIWGGTASPLGGNSQGTGALRFQSYQLDPDPFRGGKIPLVPSDAAGLFVLPEVTPVYVLQNASGPFVREVGFASDGGAQAKVVQLSLAVEGQGVSQKSLIYGTVGEPLLTGAGKVLIAQGGEGMIRTAGGNRSNRIFAAFYSREGATGDHFFGPERNYFVARNNSIFAADDDPDLEYDAVGYSAFDNSVSQAPQGSLHLARLAQNEPGLGASRSTRSLQGFAAGIGETYRPGAGTPFPAPYLLATPQGVPAAGDDEASHAAFLRLELDAASNGASLSARLGNTGVQASEVGTVNLLFGGTDSSRGAFVDDRIFAMRDATSGTTHLGDAPGIVGASAEADSFHPTGFRAIALSGQAVPAEEVLPGGVSFCSCQYTEWGWWAAEYRWGDASGPDAGRREHVHLGSFVAGELPSLSEIPLAGTASFSGHAAGNVYNQGNQYIAVGGFAGTWDFAARVGTVSITGFDTADYPGTGVAAPVNGRDFTGSAAGVTTPVGGGRIDIAGSLLRAGDDPAGAMGGRFQVTDTATSGAAYRAVGTFIGE